MGPAHPPRGDDGSDGYGGGDDGGSIAGGGRGGGRGRWAVILHLYQRRARDGWALPTRRAAPSFGPCSQGHRPLGTAVAAGTTPPADRLRPSAAPALVVASSATSSGRAIAHPTCKPGDGLPFMFATPTAINAPVAASNA